MLELDFIDEPFIDEPFIDDEPDFIEPVAEEPLFCEADEPAAVGFLPPAAVEPPAEVLPVA